MINVWSRNANYTDLITTHMYICPIPPMSYTCTNMSASTKNNKSHIEHCLRHKVNLRAICFIGNYLSSYNMADTVWHQG
jgi:hypothetical protein